MKQLLEKSWRETLTSKDPKTMIIVDGFVPCIRVFYNVRNVSVERDRTCETFSLTSSLVGPTVLTIRVIHVPAATCNNGDDVQYTLAVVRLRFAFVFAIGEMGEHS